MYHSIVDITDVEAKVGDTALIETKLLYVNSGIRREYV